MSETWLVESVVRVEGEDCRRCLDEVRDRLGGTPGVEAVDLDAQGRLLVRYDPGRVRLDDLQGQAGRVAGRMEHEVLPIRGMDCPDCAATIEKAVSRIPGVGFASLNFGAQRLLLEYDPAQVTLPTVERVIRRLGYRVPGRQETTREPLFDLRGMEARRVLLAGFLLVLGAAPVGSPWSELSWGLATALGAWTPLRRAWGALRCRRVDMNCLMVLAVVGALILGELAEAATVIFLFSVGEMLEGFAARRSRRAVEFLLQQQPEVARVERAGVPVEMPARDIQVGEIIHLHPGEQIPLDGVVLDGRSAVDQAAVTGEATPVDKQAGDAVFAGTINESGALRVLVSAPYERSTMARLLHVVEQAQARKSDQQRFVDRFAAVYTPAVVAGALLVALLGPVLLGGPASIWWYRALVLLVIACPCALVISTPVSVVSALTGALRQGILIKGGIYLERLARARVFALDKTGTLTRGSLRVVGVTSLGDEPADSVLALAAAVEANSEHPLGRAVAHHAREHEAHFEPCQEFRALPGRGAWGVVGGAVLEVGRPELLLGESDERASKLVDDLLSQGRTVVAVVRDGQPLGLVALADAPRTEAWEALEGLRRLGQRLVLVTGDHLRAAAPLAAALGIREIHAGLMPEGKLSVLRRLEADGMPVVMVGDGLNDAPALAAATVGVSMGAAGTSVALETADVALMGDDLRGLPAALSLARRARSVIVQNIVFALGTKALFLALALWGRADMWMAIAADMGASLLVTLNGLRLAGRGPALQVCDCGPSAVPAEGERGGPGHDHGAGACGCQGPQQGCEGPGHDHGAGAHGASGPADS